MSFNWARGKWELLKSAEGPNLARWLGPGEAYSIRRSPDVDAILDAHVAFWGANNPIAHALARKSGRTIASRAEVTFDFLQRHGPLGRIPESSYANFSQVICPVRTVDLDDFAESSRRIAQVWAAVNSRRTKIEDERLQDLLYECGQYVLQHDMQVLPRFKAGKFGYDLAPQSLHAVLWERIYRAFDRSILAVCLWCGQRFTPEKKRGRTPDYCPEHRGPKYRQAVYEGRAPAQRLADRTGITPKGDFYV